MSSKIYDLSIRTWFAVEQLKTRLERGDADSSGSTLRTVGIVALVLLVVSVLGFAIYSAANTAASNMNTASFKFK